MGTGRGLRLRLEQARGNGTGTRDGINVSTEFWGANVRTHQSSDGNSEIHATMSETGDTINESAPPRNSIADCVYLVLVAFSESLSVWAAPIGGTASFIDGSVSFGAAAASTGVGWAESAFR
ncbi:hypothetical protein P3T16_000953 [Paraburkholderia sp. GAS42]